MPLASSSHKKVRLIAIAIICLVILLGIACASNWTAIGSKLANPMRKVLGVGPVAKMETILFSIQDGVTRWKHKIGMAQPEAPWSMETNPQVPVTPIIMVSESRPETPSPSVASPTLIPTDFPESLSGQPEATQAVPTATTTPVAWALPAVKPFGDLAGEGVWQPYIFNADGEPVALRTFLQPDPERPYALVAVVAFDLSRTKLHFVLGSVEPSKPGGPRGSGLIPADDKQPGKLLAAFNGGFIAEHGGYGAMAGGIVPLAAKSGLATLAIYEDDQLRIGEWGKEMVEGEDYAAWRQNALMINHNGEVNPKVYTGTWEEWGANLDYTTVTLRSGIGLSEDNQILYYFAGPSLSMPVLADAMTAAGAYNSMLLDINPTHAHFTAIRDVDGSLVPEPLLGEEMNVWVDRYVRAWPWEQDFFYVTNRD